MSRIIHGWVIQCAMSHQYLSAKDNSQWVSYVQEARLFNDHGEAVAWSQMLPTTCRVHYRAHTDYGDSNK